MSLQFTLFLAPVLGLHSGSSPLAGRLSLASAPASPLHLPSHTLNSDFSSMICARAAQQVLINDT